MNAKHPLPLVAALLLCSACAPAPATSNARTTSAEPAPRATANDCHLLRTGFEATADTQEVEVLAGAGLRAAAELDDALLKGADARSLGKAISAMRQEESHVMMQIARASIGVREAAAAMDQAEGKVALEVGNAIDACQGSGKGRDECAQLAAPTLAIGSLAKGAGREAPGYVQELRKILATMRKTKAQNKEGQAAYGRAAAALEAQIAATETWRRERASFDTWRKTPANVAAMEKSDAERDRLGARLDALCPAR